jgi:hypothetical protein
MPCTNKPENAFYDSIAQESAQCSYQCVEGLESVEVNPQCVTSLDLQVERVGGATGTLIVFGLFFFLSLIMWMTIVARSSCIQQNYKDAYATVYSGVLFSDLIEDDDDDTKMVVGPEALHMRDSDIWSHVHRMYFIGENSINYPWFLTRDFPSNGLSEQSKERLLKFIKKEQWTLDWTRCESITYSIIRVLFPYVSEPYHRSIRRKHFKNAASKLYAAFDAAEWEDITSRTLRMSADEGSRLAYVDFLDYRKNKQNF